MIVLVTNTALENAGGTQTVVVELCRGLRQRGHQVMVFSSRLGHIAELLAADLFPVVNDLHHLPYPPDIIHGQHHLETMSALLALPRTPAIYYIHGVVPWQERVPLHPRILGYINLSDSAAFRLGVEKSIPPSRCYTVENQVNLGLFPSPKAAPPVLKTAVYCSRAIPLPETLKKVQRLCRRHSIELYVEQGWSKGTVADPAGVFAHYDLVFGNGRTALEALAAGCAVSITDFEKLGPLITPANLRQRRDLNFAMARWELATPQAELSRQLIAYQPAGQDEVVAFIRSECHLERGLDRLVEIYSQVVEEWRASPAVPAEDDLAAASDYLRSLIPLFSSHEAALKHRQENVRLSAQIGHLETHLAKLQASGGEEAAADHAAQRLADLRASLERFAKDHPLRSLLLRNFLRETNRLLGPQD